MTIKEFYERIGGNYEEVMGRLLTEARVDKYLKKFPQSQDYADMCSAIESADWPLAFRASHNIKGMSLNLALTGLAKSSSALCEYFRNGAPASDFSADYAACKADFEHTVAAIAELD